MARIIVVTSGKGGVGKTTTSAAFAMGLAERGFKTAVIDFDVGLRNLDLVMGCERRVVFDFVNVIQGEANVGQALIKDRRNPNLFVLPASQTRDKEALTIEGVGKVLEELGKEFEYIVCDSPAGIERGATLAMYFADDAIVVINPEVSSVRDSDRMIGILSSKSRREGVVDSPAAAMCALPSIRCGNTSDTLCTVSITRSTPSAPNMSTRLGQTCRRLTASVSCLFMMPPSGRRANAS